MKLPLRVRCGWFRFLSCCTLDVILMLAVFLGPPTVLCLYLAPHSFFEKLFTVIVTMIIGAISGICAFLGGAWFITKTTGW